MTTSEFVREMAESNQRLSRILARLRILHAATPAELAELKWLAKDDQDATIGKASGDWTK